MAIKIRAKESGGVTTVKALMSHPMETGLRKDSKTGKNIPAHHITEIHCRHNGNPVMTANFGTGISKNPYLSFKIKGAAKGDTISIHWVDNKGAEDSSEAPIA